MPATIHCRPSGVDYFAQHLEPIDISFGGLRIHAEEAYEVGARLRLDVFLPRVAPITVDAEVMWIKTLGRGAPASFEVGLAFVDLTPDALELVRPLLAQPPESVTMPESEVQPPEPPRQGSTHALLSGVPVVAVDPRKLREAQLDPRAGFLLSRIDGVTNVKGLLLLSGMPEEETLALLEHLRQLGIVVVR